MCNFVATNAASQTSRRGSAPIQQFRILLKPTLVMNKSMLVNDPLVANPNWNFECLGGFFSTATERALFLKSQKGTEGTASKTKKRTERDWSFLKRTVWIKPLLATSLLLKCDQHPTTSYNILQSLTQGHGFWDHLSHRPCDIVLRLLVGAGLSAGCIFAIVLTCFLWPRLGKAMGILLGSDVDKGWVWHDLTMITSKKAVAAVAIDKRGFQPKADLPSDPQRSSTSASRTHLILRLRLVDKFFKPQS